VSPRIRFVAGLAAICLWGSACGADGPSEYSDENREAFLAACSDGESDGLYEQRVCRCAYDEAEATMSFERFREISDELAEAEEPALPEDMLDLLAGCVIEEGDL
jgi:hypothetical protein